MLGKLAEILLSAKSSAVSGVVILAGGALVSASTGAGMTGLLEQPEPTPIVEVVDLEEDPLEILDPVDEMPVEEEEEPVDEQLPITEQDCENEDVARAEAQTRIDKAFTRFDTGLDSLKAELKGKGSSAVYEAVDSAKALLRDIRTSALEALKDMTLCDVQVASVGQVGFRGGAAALIEVSERAIAAMETVYNLARSTILKEIDRLKPTPTPKPKKTEKPKTTKAPRCDDAMYAAKKRLSKAFDTYNGGHYRLIKELKGWADDRTMDVFWAADKQLRKTYDRTKERIANAGCATGESSSMALAESAEIVFKETYASSKELFQAVIGNKPDHEGCEDHMYAAKEKMYEAFERWHGANDKLINGLKSFASEDAIEVAKRADQALHETFDRTKHQIIETACSKEHEKRVFELANTAAQFFKVTHQNALAAVAKELSERDEDDK